MKTTDITITIPTCEIVVTHEGNEDEFPLPRDWEAEAEAFWPGLMLWY